MFQTLVQFSLRQRLLILVSSLLLMAYGFFNLQQLPVDVFPDLNKPTVTLMTEAQGMAPEEVEQWVTFPIETAMNGLAGVTRVRSVSGVGLSIVFVEFAWNSDIYRNRQQVSERLNLINAQLPQGITPQLGPISSIMGEILLVAMRGDANSSAMQVRELADWVVRPRLLTLPGVAQVIPIGGEVKQYQIVPNLTLMGDLKVTLLQVETALKGFALNTSGGFLEKHTQEYLIRHLAHTTRLEDLENLVVSFQNTVPVLLKQIASVQFAARVKRGDASFNAQPAVILSVQKQPNANTLQLTAQVESVLAEINQQLPKGIKVDNLLFRQADFISAAIHNVEEALRDGAVMVAIILFLFLLNARTTLISLIAIPVSLLVTVVIFSYFGLSINTMTLGGLAIAIGELVDDAVVDVENIMRRLRAAPQNLDSKALINLISSASSEVRSGIIYATLIVVLVFVPLFALSGIEGRLFAPLGVAYIVSILASLLVSLTLTPVLCFYLLPKAKFLQQGDSWLVRALKSGDTHLLKWSLQHPQFLLSGALLLVLGAASLVPFFPRAFLPAFNEGTLTIGLSLSPGTSLSESNKIGSLAEQLLLQIPEVAQLGRRTGRAELDEHAEGVHSSEIEVDLKPSARSRAEVLQEVRQRLAALPVVVNVGQPISHRLDHLLSGVRAEIALKIFGEDLGTLRKLAEEMQVKLGKVAGVVDLQMEKQVLIPQTQVHLDYQKAAVFGVTPAAVSRALQTLVGGQVISQVLEENRRFDVVMRLPDSDRSSEGLANVLVETPTGYLPLSKIATISDSLGPNQINRDNSRRRMVVFANTDGSDMAAIISKIRAVIAATPLPEGYFINLEGQFQAQEQATRLISGLAVVSALLIFLVLYSRYHSVIISLIIMVNIPLALVGSVLALKLSNGALSVASLVGFITLAGISTRNGILKISHYLNLMMKEGELFDAKMIIRGSLERLTPVLMTAGTAICALTPLLFAGDSAGKEILHPVAVVIFGGLISATLLDTLLTPVMFYVWCRKPVERLLAGRQQVDY